MIFLYFVILLILINFLTFLFEIIKENFLSLNSVYVTVDERYSIFILPNLITVCFCNRVVISEVYRLGLYFEMENVTSFT